MHSFARYWIGSFLIALLVLTGHSMAIARGHADSISGQIVICAGTQITMVHLDADGNPTEAPRYCPDGVLSLFDLGGAALVPVAWSSARRSLDPAPAMLGVTARNAFAPSARDPPFAA